MTASQLPLDFHFLLLPPLPTVQRQTDERRDCPHRGLEIARAKGDEVDGEGTKGGGTRGSNGQKLLDVR